MQAVIAAHNLYNFLYLLFLILDALLLQDKNAQVNLELWREVEAYGDIQLMPFVDYYSLITLKTIAICTFGVCATVRAFHLFCYLKIETTLMDLLRFTVPSKIICNISLFIFDIFRPRSFLQNIS